MKRLLTITLFLIPTMLIGQVDTAEFFRDEAYQDYYSQATNGDPNEEIELSRGELLQRSGKLRNASMAVSVIGSAAVSLLAISDRTQDAAVMGAVMGTVSLGLTISANINLTKAGEVNPTRCLEHNH